MKHDSTKKKSGYTIEDALPLIAKHEEQQGNSKIDQPELFQKEAVVEPPKKTEEEKPEEPKPAEEEKEEPKGPPSGGSETLERVFEKGKKETASSG